MWVSECTGINDTSIGRSDWVQGRTSISEIKEDSLGFMRRQLKADWVSPLLLLVLMVMGLLGGKQIHCVNFSSEIVTKFTGSLFLKLFLYFLLEILSLVH